MFAINGFHIFKHRMILPLEYNIYTNFANLMLWMLITIQIVMNVVWYLYKFCQFDVMYVDIYTNCTNLHKVCQFDVCLHFFKEQRLSSPLPSSLLAPWNNIFQICAPLSYVRYSERNRSLNSRRNTIRLTKLKQKPEINGHGDIYMIYLIFLISIKYQPFRECNSCGMVSQISTRICDRLAEYTSRETLLGRP